MIKWLKLLIFKLFRYRTAPNLDTQSTHIQNERPGRSVMIRRQKNVQSDIKTSERESDFRCCEKRPQKSQKPISGVGRDKITTREK